MEHFGKLLTQGLKSIAALEKIDLTELQYDLGKEIGVSVWTIYKWRKGTSIPNDDRTISLLARACIHRGRMDRQWLADFLRNTIHSNKQLLSEELFHDDSNTVLTHNLPRRQHIKLIGRDKQLAEINNFLSPRHRVGVVCISGGGGVGKTALALEAAYSCFENNANLPLDERFAAIVWVTAKHVELLPAGQATRQPTFSDLESVYRAIADLLDIPIILRTASQAEQNIIVTRLLVEKRILLVLDNLEDVDNHELMIFLRDLPSPSKAIITTRHRIDVAVPVYLHSLDEATAYELVHLECVSHSLILSDEQIKLLLQRTGGLPLALIRTIGRMAWRGSSVETEIQYLEDPTNEIYDFCFGKTLALIQGGDAGSLFMALALFGAEPTREALGYVAGLGEDWLRRDEGLSDLEVLSLCHKNGERFGIEQLTRMRALTELRQHREFDIVSRERWVSWYKELTAHYGGRDGLEMHLRFDYLEADWNNILAVMRWCIGQGRYEDVKAFWENVRDFTHIYGFWADRLSLLDALTVAADNRRDYPAAVQLMYDRAFTLTLTGPLTRLEEAGSLLQRCWTLREYSDLALQARVAALSASLCIKQGKNADANQWLDKAEELLKVSDLEPIELARERTSMLFDRGENWLMMGDYPKAQEVFEEMLAQGEIGGWQRSVIHAQNWLAYTALLQKQPIVSNEYLLAGWPVAKRIKEQRLEAYFKRTFAYYYHEIGEQTEALKWAEDALDSFERLGMPPDSVEMHELITQINLVPIT